MPADSGKRPDGLRGLAALLTTVVVATFALTSAAFVVVRPGPETPLEIRDVRAEPATPVPDQSLTVFATASGGSEFATPSVRLFHATSFRNELARVDRMQSLGNGTFTLVIGPFASGAEVWMFAAASTPSQGPVFSDHLMLSVGTVYRNASLLSIGNTFLSPASPGPQTPITVFTRVTSFDFVSSVFLSYGWFGRGASGAGNRFMGTPDGTSYVAPIEFGRTFPAGTRFFYRVAASDFNGVAANSEVLSFEISVR